VGAPESNEVVMAIEIDPVCGMQVDTETSELSFEFDGTTYWFCGKGCLLEFRDDPKTYLSSDHVPSM
jgi:Cu+-exporting ATPase